MNRNKAISFVIIGIFFGFTASVVTMSTYFKVKAEQAKKTLYKDHTGTIITHAEFKQILFDKEQYERLFHANVGDTNKLRAEWRHYYQLSENLKSQNYDKKLQIRE